MLKYVLVVDMHGVQLPPDGANLLVLNDLSAAATAVNASRPAIMTVVDLVHYYQLIV